MANCLNAFDEINRLRKERDMLQRICGDLRKRLEIMTTYDVRKIIIVQPKDDKPIEVTDEMIINILEQNRKDNHDKGNNG